MILNEVLTEELLQQAAAELATALIDSLPPPNECHHKFSDGFEEKILFSILSITILVLICSLSKAVGLRWR